jgi:hypothetical protein
MTAERELKEFVAAALARGIGRDEIAAALTQAGWPRDRIAEGLRGFADVPFPIAVPRPRPSLSAREAFIYLLLFATLYISAISLNAAVFKLIERAFPDPADRSYMLQSAEDTLRWSIALLIIASPIFLWMNRLVARAVTGDPAKRASRIRKWLTYLTLFGAAMVLIVDLATLVYNLLGGDLTSRFLLKVLTTAIISGAIILYYLWDVRDDEREPAT